MKLIRMHVDNFGGLHDYDYEFSEGLNVLLEDNGWGKTTMAAFLKAMLYGFDTKRSKDITENERRRYLPWQGGKYGGSLDFEAEGKRYRVFRTFGETPRFDAVKILDLDKGTSAKIDPEKLGETLFGLDVSAFQRSVFINQNGLSIDGAASSIHTRLNALVSQANDLAAYDGAINDLTQQIKVYEKTGARGKLGELSREITEKERRRDQLEREIEQQDAARERVSRIDMLLAALDAGLEEKKARLEEVSGEVKELEASKKLLADLLHQSNELRKKMDAVRMELGGSIPDSGEIDRVKKQCDTYESGMAKLAALSGQQEERSLQLQALEDSYQGELPTQAQLDELQGLYSQLQGLAAGVEKKIDDEEEPEGYRLIASACEQVSPYPALLREAITGQSELDRLTRALEESGREIHRESELWEEKQERYRELKREQARCESELDRAPGTPEQRKAAIQSLAELQKTQQVLDRKQTELAGKQLTVEEAQLLADAPAELPDENEIDELLDTLRSAERREAELQGLDARLTGEESRAESLRTALEQYRGLPETETLPVEPKKPANAAMVGGGVLALIGGAVLGVLVQPVLAALALLGVILVALGVSSGKRYQTQRQSYEAAQAELARQRDARAKKRELEKELQSVQDTIDALRKERDGVDSDIEADRLTIKNWLTRYEGNTDAGDETAIRAVAERAERIQALRGKAAEAEEAQRELSVLRGQLDAGKAEIIKDFPELRDKSYEQGIEWLRAEETADQLRQERFQRANRDLEQFLTSTKLTEEQLADVQSPRMAELRTEYDQAEQALTDALALANSTLGLIGLQLDAENYRPTLRRAEQLLSAYQSHREKLAEREARLTAHRRKQDALEQKLETAALVLRGLREELPLPNRIAAARQELETAARLRDGLEEAAKELAALRPRLEEAEKAYFSFKQKYAPALPDDADAIAAVQARADSYAKWAAAMQQLEQQKVGVHVAEPDQSIIEEEERLRREIEEDGKRRDELLVEYTQKLGDIRQADRALEAYPDTVREIRLLYEQKQKAQSRLITLKRASQLITKAKENLANRYLGKVEGLFNRYLQIWLNSDAVRGILDTDFKVQIEENGKLHVAEGYSTGTGDLIDFCMRLALVDTLYEKEKPFLILDDPFVNLDADHLEKALELLDVMAANKQLVYLVCHPIRAAEAVGDSRSRSEFKQLAEETKKTLAAKKSAGAARVDAPKKSPRELYHIPAGAQPAAIRPARPDMAITNSIFSMGFVADDRAQAQDRSYELFFLDEKGRVLNERQLIEVHDGKLSTERVQFSLNTWDDSGGQYELIIRESGQDDYEIVARFPFRVKLAFAGTFSFD